LNFLYTDKPPLRKKRLLNQIQERIDRADIVTTISRYVKEDLEKHLDLTGKDVRVIYNGVELKEFPGFDNPGYRPAKPFLFALGTVLYKKHFHVLPALLTENDFELVIGGIHPDKEYIKRIEKEARLHGVWDRVKLIGPVSDEEKYWYMKNAEAFLFPSISEGFGLPPIEAMRLGKPVFLSVKTSLPEIGGDAAYYFENFEPEHMREVLRKGLEDYQRNNRAEQIIRRSMLFTWENAVKEYVRAYRDAMDGTGGKSNEKNIFIEGTPDPKITAIIPTYNEERNIAQAIDSVKWADEVLVIDSHSTDKTVEIAESKGARVLLRKFDNFSAQKNYAIHQARNDWIFVLDADERVTGGLKKEILQVLQKGGKFTAFWVPRENYIGNKKIRFSGWQNDKCIRLFNKRWAEYNGRYVHEEVKAHGRVGKLSNKLQHFTYRSYEQFGKKLDFYARLKAMEWYEKGRKYHHISHLIIPLYRFFKHYFLHFGFLCR
jgi:hypothetical protein